MTQLVELQEYYGEFQKAGVRVYAVSVDPPEVNVRLKARLGAGYEFLSDAKAELLAALDIRQMNRSGTGEANAIPTQYLLDPQGVVRWFHRGVTWRVRPHPREALKAIDLVSPDGILRQVREPSHAAPGTSFGVDKLLRV